MLDATHPNLSSFGQSPTSNPYMPRRPDAQGFYGPSGPDATSTLQGPQGVRATSAQTATGYPQPPQTTPPRVAGPGNTGTPVLADGRIPPPAAPAAPPQTGAPVQASGGLNSTAVAAPPLQTAGAGDALPPGAVDIGNGLVRFPDGQILPRNHPLYAQKIATFGGGGGAPGASPQGQALANVINGGQAGGVGGMQLGDPAQLSQAAAPVYNPYQFSMFGQQHDPTNPLINFQADQLVQSLLANPHSMGAVQVAMLQEQQKEQALAQQQALQQALTQQQVQSGFEMGGGYQQAQTRRLGDATNMQLLQGNRDIALQKMQQDRQDELNALQAAMAHQGQVASRAMGLYGAQLSGEQAQAGQQLQGYASQSDAFNNHQGTALNAMQLALQQALGNRGLDIDTTRVNNQNTQFGQSMNLNWAALMNDMLMGRANYGLNLAGLQQGAQNDMFRILFGG